MATWWSKLAYLRDNLNTSVVVAKNIRTNLKNGRKIFKFLKSVDEIKAMRHLIQKCDWSVLWILRMLSKIFGSLYYALDNIEWLTSLGLFKSKPFWFLERDVGGNSLNQLKYRFASFKNLVNILHSIISLWKVVIKELELTEKLMSYESHNMVGKDKEIINTIWNLIKVRREKRFKIIDMGWSLLRLVMLIFKLRIGLPWFDLNPIFYSICGLVSKTFSIFKQISKQRHDNFENWEVSRELEELHEINNDLQQ